jgi:hypothetical protein
MRKAIAIGAVGIMGLLGACTDGDASKADLDEPESGGDVVPKDYSVKAPDSITVYVNVNEHPTINKVCLEGVAFRTISTAHSQGGFNEAVSRVPEWDETC